MLDTINYWILDKNHILSDIYFCMDIMVGMVREDFFIHLFWKYLVTRDK